MHDLGIRVGDATRFSKTVGETDIYLFAGITGDLSPNHVNEQAMQATSFGGRIAHGALLIGYISTCSTKMAEKAATNGAVGVPLSLGFDKIRFLKPVRLGDTVTIDYSIAAIDEERRRAQAAVTVTNQSGELVAVADHILKWSE
ncbi:MaoC family dehydratase [Sphingobium tyrosinilyticum]|uniref:MaoC family dehydratase n=1 Tax=Sphingobium tyrosinilyticum TaxID=2715436 RepID=A0ABV9EZZ8_9SPHN